MSKIGLALSGGGFRASLFHLGVIRYLINTKMLDSIKSVSSVSGGSVVAAHLVLNWDRYTNDNLEVVDNCFQEVIDLITSDVRGKVLRRTGFLRGMRIKYFKKELDKLYKGKRLNDKDIRENAPELYILATNMLDGSRIVFSKDNYSIRSESGNPTNIGTDSIPVALAVAASAAFPAIFSPVEITKDNLGVDSRVFRDHKHYLSDGGILDNSGIDIVNTLLDSEEVETVLISDASGSFDFDDTSYSGFLGVLKTSLRSTDIMMEKISDFSKFSIGKRNVKFIPISGKWPRNSSDISLSKKSRNLLKHIRTDLDSFSKLEINALILHGQKVAQSILDNDDSTPWIPIKETDMFSASIDPIDIEKHLEKSSTRKLGLLSLKDISGTIILILYLIVITAPILIWYLYNHDRYSFDSYPFTFSMHYPDDLDEIYSSCFSSFDRLSNSKCHDISNSTNTEVYIKDIREKLSDKENAKVSDGKIKNVLSRYCKFKNAKGTSGEGKGYMLIGGQQGIFGKLHSLYSTDKEKEEGIFQSKGFILFNFDEHEKKEHGFSFVTRLSKDEEFLEIQIAQPKNHGKQGGIWDARFRINKSQLSMNIDKLLQIEITGYTTFDITGETTLPLETNLPKNCNENQKPGVMRFSEITLKKR